MSLRSANFATPPVLPQDSQDPQSVARSRSFQRITFPCIRPLEEMDSSQRALLLGGLDTEHASDTLEEIDPAVQRDIVFALSKELVAELIAEMTPGQAADIISVLPGAERRGILKLLEPAYVAKIAEIIEKQGTTILNFATASFFKCSPETTVEQARKKFRDAAKS